jgi:hypothetical protein
LFYAIDCINPLAGTLQGWINAREGVMSKCPHGIKSFASHRFDRGVRELPRTVTLAGFNALRFLASTSGCVFVVIGYLCS